MEDIKIKLSKSIADTIVNKRTKVDSLLNSEGINSKRESNSVILATVMKKLQNKEFAKKFIALLEPKYLNATDKDSSGDGWSFFTTLIDTVGDLGEAYYQEGTASNQANMSIAQAEAMAKVEEEKNKARVKIALYVAGGLALTTIGIVIILKTRR
jgi:hypothetical protein